MSGAQNEHQKRVAAGLKAALHNPNVSADAKESARERLAEMNPTHKDHSELTNRQLAGYKAALKNPNVTDEAKAHARDVLNSGPADPVDHPNARVLGGYKAALHNPHVSNEAKEHAERVLEENSAI